MSWIRSHWEAEYIADAEQKIKATVSFNVFIWRTVEMTMVLDVGVPQAEEE